jgi:ATP-binding cassette subfamily B protein
MLRHAWPYRRWVIALMIVAGATAGIDALFTYLMRPLIDEASAKGRQAVLWPYAAGYAGLSVLMGLSIWTFILIAGKVTTNVSHDIRAKCFAKLQELSFSYYDQRAVGWLMARLTSDCDRLSRLMGWGLTDLTWGATFLVTVAVILLVVYWKLALAVFVVLPLLGYVTKAFQKYLLLTSRAARKANSILTAAYNESLMGVRTTKTLVREAQNLSEFRGLSTGMYDIAVRNALLSAMYWPFVGLMGATGAGMAIWIGGREVLAGSITLGTLVMFIAFAQRFFDPVHEMARIFTDILGAQAAAERVQGLLDTTPEIKDSADVLERLAAHDAKKGQEPYDLRLLTPSPASADTPLAPDGLPDRVGTLEFRDVSFAYKQGQPVLNHFDLTVRPGETIALVGPTGGGKTTIVSLLARFYEPTAGEILVDGTDYRQRSLHWWQSQLGIVQQAPHLFSGTVRENIAYGDLEATEDEVLRAARLANAHDFIAVLDKGYDTPVGPGGNRLSTGQKQLVALARAILADPRIFIMDEATSSVDTETERLIQKGLDAMLKGRTSFVIAHRLSTIRSADRILVIEKGRIVEAGTHHDLLRARGRYYTLYTSQFTRQMEEEALKGSDGVTK